MANVNREPTIRRRRRASAILLSALGVLLSLSCQRAAPAAPCAANQTTRRFRIECAEGDARLGRDCGLLAYAWFSREGMASFNRQKCDPNAPDACHKQRMHAFREGALQRYAKAEPRAVLALLGRLKTDVDVANPLVFETLLMLTHNYALRHYPGTHPTKNDTGKAQNQDRAAQVARAVSADLLARIGRSARGLPTHDCPQRVLADGPCEGPFSILAEHWRRERLRFQIVEHSRAP